MVESAGLLVIRNNRILLCHPSNANWIATFSIPKGLIDEGEDHLTCAIRETFEETGIMIDESKIDKTEHFVNYYKGKTIIKRVYYFIADGSDINLENEDNPNVVLRKNLVPNKDGLLEVDWAGFVDKKEAEKVIFWRFRDMLKYIEHEKETGVQ
jgi:ADP-ribose pyrophosphatase YjhB (NUDIX family)